MNSIARPIALALLGCQLFSCAEPTPGKRIQVTAEFAGGNEMSGLSSLDGKTFVLVSNETRTAQTAVWDAASEKLTPGNSFAFPGTPGDGEMDLEAVAVDPTQGYFYISGSHAVSKTKGKPRLEQNMLARFKLNPQGNPTDMSLGSLGGVFSATPAVSAKFGAPLQLNGVNVEDLAVWQGKLWVGMRSPMVEGKAIILEMPVDAPFKSPAAAATVHSLDLGKNMAIRDLCTTKSGLLLIAGESGAPASEKFPSSEGWSGDGKFSIWFWGADSTKPATKVMELAKQSGSAEGIHLLQESETEWKVLILRDGQPNGGPQVFAVQTVIKY